MSGYKFLRIYKQICHETARQDDIVDLYWDLKTRLPNNSSLQKWFKKQDPKHTEMAIAIDAVAHEIHKNGESILCEIYPSSSISLFKSCLDELSGMETETDFRKKSRGYFTPILDDSELFILNKSTDLKKEIPRVARVTKDDIKDSIKEYETLYKARLSTPAELLTLARYYPEGNKYEIICYEKGYFDNEPLVVGGPCSVEEVDQESHLITMEGMKKAFERFMKNIRTRNINVFHSDAQVGWALPAYISSDGFVYRSGVDDHCAWLISELRDDVGIAKRTAEEVRKGTIKSYSIAGNATDVKPMQKGSKNWLAVLELELMEVTLCLIPGTKVWTKVGLKKIENVQAGDYVWTHQSRWRKVLKTFSRYTNEEILNIYHHYGQTIGITKEHPIRKIVYEGKHKGSHYDWVPAKEIKIGDLISYHQYTGNCDYCNAPLFKRLETNSRNFCDRECRYSAIGNRSKKSEKYRNSEEDIKIGLSTWPKVEREIIVCKVCNTEFEASKRLNRQYCSQDCHYIDAVGRKMLPSQVEKMRQKVKDWWANMPLEEKVERVKKLQNTDKRPSGPELRIGELLQKAELSQWRYVGDNSFLIQDKNPDFLDFHSKKVIEVQGCYWHSCPMHFPNNSGYQPNDFLYKKKIYDKMGYESIEIWECEINQEPDQVSKKVIEFSNNKLAKVTDIRPYSYEGYVHNLEVEEDNSYTTEFGVVHNCEQGVNKSSRFDILKSMTKFSENVMVQEPKILEKMSSIIFKGFGLYLSSDQKGIIIVADRPNSITDEIAFNIQKSFPDIEISILESAPFGSIPIFNQISLERDLEESIEEERQAVKDYSKRSQTAQSAGRTDIARLYDHIAEEEETHEEEFEDFLESTEEMEKHNEVHPNIKALKESNYRPSKEEYVECHSCIFMTNTNWCLKLHLPVDPEYVCDYFKPNPNPVESEQAAEAMGAPYELMEKSKMNNIEKLKDWLQKAKDKEWNVADGEDDRRKSHKELLERYGISSEDDEYKDDTDYSYQTQPWVVSHSGGEKE